MPPPDPQRPVSFYLEDVGGHQELAVDGELEVVDGAGRRVGTFPHQKGEPFSWYLCDCERPPNARRAIVAAELACPVCKRSQPRLVACSCGVVSPTTDAPVCLWCGRAAGAGHECRAVGGGIEVFHNASLCPLCRRAPIASPQSAAPAARTERLAEAMTTQVESREPLKGAAAEAAPVAHPAAPWIPPEPRREPGPVRRWQSYALGFVVPLLMVAAVVIWYARTTTYARIGAALERGDLVAPPGDCAIDLYQRQLQEHPGAEQTGLALKEVVGVLLPAARKWLQALKAEADDGKIDWGSQSKLFDFLVGVMPADQELIAGQHYCAGQVAWKGGKLALAREEFKAAHRQQLEWYPARIALAKLYMVESPLKNLTEAERIFEEVHRQHQELPSPLVNLARIALAENRPEKAVVYCQQALARDAKHADALYELGRAERTLGRLPEALHAFQDALAADQGGTKRREIAAIVDQLHEQVR